jgi:hypothetical protein
MTSEEIMVRHGQRVILLWAAHHAEAEAAMCGIAIESGRALTSRALIAAFCATRGWVEEKGLF